MLRNVLEDYLKSIVERDFDYPLTSLLQAKGFYDIHFTHGGVEFGKDFIAKKIDKGIEYQYAIQSKKGDINQGLWRNEIRGQLEEAILSDLSHPQFDKSLPRKAILVTTGRLVGNATILAQEFKDKLQNNALVQELIFWDKEQLIQFSEESGLSGIHQNTIQGLRGFAQFFLIYSKAIEGNLSDREIEEYSRLWLDNTLDYKKRILRACIEGEIIASKLLERGLVYEAIFTYLSLARCVMDASYETDDQFVIQIYNELVAERVLVLGNEFLKEFQTRWIGAKKSLLHLCMAENSFPMLQYIVWCARVLEICSLFLFLSRDEIERKNTLAFMGEFLKKEKGCGHVPSDRYAVSMVWVVLALLKAKKKPVAQTFIKNGVNWLCDRIEKGFGIARYEADEDEQTQTILGYPFDFIKIEKNTSSYLATVLTDLAAFLDDKNFYEDVVNDFAACDVAYNYWQFPDSRALFIIESDECRNYPNIPHKETINTFDDYEYALHLNEEPESLQITEKAGLSSLVILSILLRDRYFPTFWKRIIE